MDIVTVPKSKFEKLKRENKLLRDEVETLRNTKLYQRLVVCLQNLKEKEYTRKDLGI